MPKPDDKSPTELKKVPVQKRSKALVESIIGAAARIFGSGKTEDLNTNRVAELAGVSIGSLYEYFPGKEAIATALGRKLVHDTFEGLAATLDANEGEPIEGIVRALVDAFIAKKLGRLELERSIVRAAIQHGFFNVMIDLDEEMMALFIPRIEKLQARGLLRPGVKPELATYVLYQSLRAIMIIGSLQKPEMLGTPELRAELERLVLGYLKP
jgi:AcrR family transcriptional regulator